MASGGRCSSVPHPPLTATKSVLPFGDMLGHTEYEEEGEEEEEEGEEEEVDGRLDPRVKNELDSLNQAASDVNRLEKEIDSAREKYQLTFNESSQQLEQLKKKIQGSIKKARPYYELKEMAKDAQSEAVRSARKFQAANGVYLAAKETIALAELRLMDDKAVSLSAAWQEMLNHALYRVTNAEIEKTKAEKEHLKLAAHFAQVECQLHGLEKKYKKSIEKARFYFETKKELEIKLQQLKQTLEDLQQAMRSAKRRYSFSLRSLESISDGIHEKRRRKLLMMLPREPGVGAEEENEETTQRDRLPSLATSFTTEDDHALSEAGDQTFLEEEELDDIDEEFLAYQDIQNESIFRAKVLNTALDDDDTSFMDKGAFRERKRRLLRAKSLPVNIDQRSKTCGSFLFQHESTDHGGDSVAVSKEVGRGVFQSSDTSLKLDRNENSPPDGDSLSNEHQFDCDSASSVDGVNKDICERSFREGDSVKREICNDCDSVKREISDDCDANTESDSRCVQQADSDKDANVLRNDVTCEECIGDDAMDNSSHSKLDETENKHESRCNGVGSVGVEETFQEKVSVS